MTPEVATCCYFDIISCHILFKGLIVIMQMFEGKNVILKKFLIETQKFMTLEDFILVKAS